MHCDCLSLFQSYLICLLLPQQKTRDENVTVMTFVVKCIHDSHPELLNLAEELPTLIGIDLAVACKPDYHDLQTKVMSQREDIRKWLKLANSRDYTEAYDFLILADSQLTEVQHKMNDVIHIQHQLMAFFGEAAKDEQGKLTIRHVLMTLKWFVVHYHKLGADALQKLTREKVCLASTWMLLLAHLLMLGFVFCTLC